MHALELEGGMGFACDRREDGLECLQKVIEIGYNSTVYEHVHLNVICDR